MLFWNLRPVTGRDQAYAQRPVVQQFRKPPQLSSPMLDFGRAFSGTEFAQRTVPELGRRSTDMTGPAENEVVSRETPDQLESGMAGWFHVKHSFPYAEFRKNLVEHRLFNLFPQ